MTENVSHETMDPYKVIFPRLYVMSRYEVVPHRERLKQFDLLQNV